MSRKLPGRAPLTDQRAGEIVDAVVADLRARNKSIKCGEMGEHLKSLGFTLTLGKTDGHKIVSHGGLADFTTASYDCGHARNGIIKLPYVVKIIRAITDFREGLISFLKDQS